MLVYPPEYERRKKKGDKDELSTALSTLLAAASAASIPPGTGTDFHLGTGELFTASKDKTIKIWDLRVCIRWYDVILLTLFSIRRRESVNLRCADTRQQFIHCKFSKRC